MKIENLRFRQAIFENGKFIKWHYWGFVDHRYDFVGPITIVGINIKYDIMDSQQFTGEIDYNNRSIYEGDKIINQSRNERQPHPIVFYKGKFLGDYGGLYYDFSQEIGRERIEVVGNIHE